MSQERLQTPTMHNHASQDSDMGPPNSSSSRYRHHRSFSNLSAQGLVSTSHHMNGGRSSMSSAGSAGVSPVVNYPMQDQIPAPVYIRSVEASTSTIPYNASEMEQYQEHHHQHQQHVSPTQQPYVSPTQPGFPGHPLQPSSALHSPHASSYSMLPTLLNPYVSPHQSSPTSPLSVRSTSMPDLVAYHAADPNLHTEGYALAPQQHPSHTHSHLRSSVPNGLAIIHPQDGFDQNIPAGQQWRQEGGSVHQYPHSRTVSLDMSSLPPSSAGIGMSHSGEMMSPPMTGESSHSQPIPLHVDTSLQSPQVGTPVVAAWSAPPLSVSAQQIIQVYSAYPTAGNVDTPVHVFIHIVPHEPHLIRGFRVMFGAYGTTTRVVEEYHLSDGGERVELVASTPPLAATAPSRYHSPTPHLPLTLQALDEHGVPIDWAEIGSFTYVGQWIPAYVIHRKYADIITADPWTCVEPLNGLSLPCRVFHPPLPLFSHSPL